MSDAALHKCRDIQNGVAFCYPQEKEGRYFVAVDPGVYPRAEDDRYILIKNVKKFRSPPKPVVSPPSELADKIRWRFYDITESIPAVIPENDWRYGANMGPNCYSAVLCAEGFEDLCGRYVDASEAEFFARLYFRPVEKGRCGNEFGTIAVFREGKSENKYEMDWVGTHMAFSLLGGMVFHKLSYHYNDGYRIDRIEDAMTESDKATVKHFTDPYERMAFLRKKHEYRWHCFALDKTPDAHPPLRPLLSNERRRYFIGLFNYYSKRILDISKNGNRPEKFDALRLSILSVENLRKLLADLRLEVTPDLKTFLVRDWSLAAAYYRAESLLIQHQMISDRFNPVTERNYREIQQELNRRHYLKIDDEFIGETYAHLAARGIDKNCWVLIRNAVIRELTSKEGEIQRSTGGIPFYDILEMAIIESLGR